MLKVGLTGGIGAGKSTVSRRLAQAGAVVVDADLLAREVVAPGSDGLAAVVEAFGPSVLAGDGSLDRPALGRIVFADPAARATLNAITHPRIALRTLQAYTLAPADAVVVHDVPLLVENGMGANYHLVVVVHAPELQRVRRLVTTRGMTEDDAWARVRAQADDAARRAAADVWLDNTGAEADLLAAVDRLWQERLVPFEANLRLRRPAARPEPTPVVDPDPTWPVQAQRLVARLDAALDGAARSVTHVGPTAAGDRPAADVLDLEVVVRAAAAPTAGEALAEAGYACDDAGGEAGGEGERRLFRSCDPGRAVDVHLAGPGAEEAAGPGPE